MASAQEENSSPAQTIDGRPVSRVTFDRETVTIYYTDGTEQTVDQATIVRSNRVTGITTVKTDDSMPAGKNSDGIFDLQEGAAAKLMQPVKATNTPAAQYEQQLEQWLNDNNVR
ncbi:MAG TPA: hypothetical protein DCQ56_00230 [Porphyromonadaceae bacterium]|nr:hypothetical protein [Porphyromonadaceae bacterium]